jgi:uncharacterized protein
LLSFSAPLAQTNKIYSCHAAFLVSLPYKQTPKPKHTAMGDGMEVANPAKMPALVRPGKSPEMAVHGPMDTMGLLILPNELLIEILEIVVEEKSDIRSWFNLMRINRRIAGLMNGVRGSITADPASFSKYSLVTKRSAALFRRANLLPLFYSETQFGHFSDGLAVQLNDLLSEQQMTRAVMRDGSTPLIFACRKGYYDAVWFLVQRAQDFDSGATDAFGRWVSQQPASADALMGSQSVLGKMLRARDYQGRTALHSACDARENALEIVGTLLIAAKLRPNLLEFVVSTADKDGETPLMVACGRSRLELAKTLVDNGADVMAKNNKRETALHAACSTNHFFDANNVTGYLIEIAEGDPEWEQFRDAQDSLGRTALYVACVANQDHKVIEMLNARADMEIATNEGKTPLYIACEDGRSLIADSLLGRGANVNFAGPNGMTPIMAAIGKSNFEIAVHALSFPVVQIDLADNDGNTALHYAVEKYHVGTFDAVIGKLPNLDTANNDGETPLYIACKWGRLDVVRLLVEKGADLNKANNYGDTPLHMARSKGHTDIVRFLRTAGARK